MNDSKISVRYSKALFQTALDSNIIEKVMADMALITEVYKVPEMKEFLLSPIIPPSKKENIFHKIFEGNVQNVTLSLLDLLVKNGRESFLPAIARSFMRQTRIHRGVTEAVLTTAVPVDEKVRKQVSSLVENTFSTKVELSEVVDPDIIGGFILRVEDNYIDASIKNKLRKVRKDLLGSIKSR